MFKSKLISLWIWLNGLVPEDYSHTAGRCPHLDREHPFTSLHSIHQTLHSSGKSLKLSFEKCLLQNLSPITHAPLWGVIMSHPALQRAAAALPCAAVRDLSASAYWDGLHWNFILWISPWNMDILTLKRNTENIAHCTGRQKQEGAAGVAGAKRAPRPASCPQQWLKADSKSKSENKASVCCEFPVHHCFLHCLRYLCILNFFTQVELLQTCLGPISAHFHLKLFIYPIYLFILISFLLQSI